jgi:hypothetical protein
VFPATHDSLIIEDLTALPPISYHDNREEKAVSCYVADCYRLMLCSSTRGPIILNMGLYVYDISPPQQK